MKETLASNSRPKLNFNTYSSMVRTVTTTTNININISQHQTKWWGSKPCRKCYNTLKRDFFGKNKTYHGRQKRLKQAPQKALQATWHPVTFKDLWLFWQRRMIHICLCILSQNILNLLSELKGFIWVVRDQAYGCPTNGYCICRRSCWDYLLNK